MTDPQYSREKYRDQLNNKIAAYTETVSNLDFSEIDVFPSQPLGFRMRAEFRIWHEDGKAHYAMNRPGEKRPYIITQFPIGGPLITQLMTPLLLAINSSSLLSKKLFSLEFLTTRSGEVLVTLIYHRPLDTDWEVEAKALQEEFSIGVIGRSKKQKVVLQSDFVTETLEVDGREYSYQQVESGFTQPNAGINQQMLTMGQSVPPGQHR